MFIELFWDGIYVLSSFFDLCSCLLISFGSYKHYLKIDKYKQKYRGNIFIGKCLTDFTDGNILSVYTEGITVGKK
jgi:hypothetical protein